MDAYSMDLRERVFLDCDAGMPTGEVAAKYRVSPAWVRRLKQRRAETGETGPRPRPPRPGKLAAESPRIAGAFRETPDATLAEVRARLGLAAGITTLWRAVKALGLTVKKKSSGRPSRTGRRWRPSASSGGPPSP